MAQIKDLVGKTLTEIKNDLDEIIFIVDDGIQYKMYHGQDCCENVFIDDINGDLNAVSYTHLEWSSFLV